MSGNLDLIKSRGRTLGAAALVLGILILAVGFQGNKYAAGLHGILGLLIAGAGVVIFTACGVGSLRVAGVRLVLSGWILLPMGVAGFLLTPGGFYAAGLGVGLLALEMALYGVTAVVGLYTLVWANRETGVPMAP